MTSSAISIALRGTAALCALTTAVIHLLLTPEYLEEMPYVGILFLVGGLALLYTAGGLARRNSTPAWLIGTLVTAGMFVGFLLSRTVGLPGFHEEDWEPPYGILSLIAEGVFVLAYVAETSRAMLRTRGALSRGNAECEPSRMIL
ncbi:hypothetical protein [Streptomyces sp. NPDC051776]|uniref:hypothetical protein n=1 Tax=Streptomyces sp. NPDC051776 TaxID=3155414 RepID=UPI00342C621A